MNPTEPDEELSRLLEYFAERLNLVFAYFFFVVEFKDDRDFGPDRDPGKNDRTWALETIQNACLHSTLTALRDLDDFLALGKSQKDDLRASAFGFNQDLRFLAKSERQAINKNIVHTTKTGAEAHRMRWDVFELVNKGVIQSIAFLQWIESHYTLRHFLLYTAAIATRIKTEAILQYVTEAVEVERKSGEGKHIT